MLGILIGIVCSIVLVIIIIIVIIRNGTGMCHYHNHHNQPRGGPGRGGSSSPSSNVDQARKDAELTELTKSLTTDNKENYKVTNGELKMKKIKGNNSKKINNIKNNNGRCNLQP